MTDPVDLRMFVRTALSTLPQGRRMGETMLYTHLRQDFAELRVEELRAAIEWNHARGYIDFRRNHDLERDEWALTETGRAKEGL